MEAWCLGRSTCTWRGKISHFGSDPCPGVGKRTFASVRCSASQAHSVVSKGSFNSVLTVDPAAFRLPAVASSASYTYKKALTPLLTSMKPKVGSTAGGTTLTITGSGFGDSSTPPVIKVGGVLCATTTAEVGEYQGKNLCEWGADSVHGVRCEDMFHNDTLIRCITNPSGLPMLDASVEVNIAGKGFASPCSSSDGSSVVTCTAAHERKAQYSYADRWSASTTWGYLPPPVEGDSVVIGKGQYIFYDVSAPPLNMLIIEGALVFDDTQDLTLDASYIFVKNGTMRIGTEAEPHQHKAVVTLHGNRRSFEIPIYGSVPAAVLYLYATLYAT
jgi:hypothetical protein